MAKSKAAAEAKNVASQQQSPTIMQGLGNLAQTVSAGIREGRAERDLDIQQAGQRKLMGEIDPATGATQQQVAAMGEYDPEMMTQLWTDRAAKLRADAERDNWQPLTPEERTGLGLSADDPTPYVKNITTGDIKSLKSAEGDKITIGGETDPFFKKLDEKSGETWAQYEAGGPKGAAAMQDIALMRELQKAMGPNGTGPVPGYIAERIGNFSNAGAAYASIIERLKPTLHVEGSGATSDLEFASFAKSLPSLKNYPEANAAILDVMQQKAELQQKMGEIASKVANRQMSRAEGSAAWQQLYTTHLNIPENLQKLIAKEAMARGGAEANPGFTDEELDAEIERRRLAKEGGGQ
jgi:hypothetical protein